MSIRDCAVVAIDGTHASGKTTVIHALTAHYRRLGVNAVAMGEPARSSPYIEEVVLHGRGTFDIAAEVDVFAAHLRDQLRAARNHELLIADKTVVNVLAYARLLLDPETTGPDTGSTSGVVDAAVLDAMHTFCRAWAPSYDLVVLARDHFTQPSDRFRVKVDHLQHDAATAVSELYRQLGIGVHELPRGMETDERVRWIAERIADAGLLRTG